VTDRGEPWLAKGIHYRMHPGNVDVFGAARIDCCVLANNHILDWSYAGLAQTLDSLHDAGIITAGAGADAGESRRPAVIETHSGSRVIVLAVGTESSGIPASWSAAADRAGVWLLRSLTGDAVDEINAAFDEVRQPGDMAVVSIHWGPNWGYAVPWATDASPTRSSTKQEWTSSTATPPTIPSASRSTETASSSTAAAT
jgi:poly-gamma-glutamate capsule biosynthesis protein CapA/YwtB (metallophosphatase superfamily)